MISEKWQSALAVTPIARPLLGSSATLEITTALTILLADIYSLYDPIRREMCEKLCKVPK
jgi:hypothetical protein